MIGTNPTGRYTIDPATMQLKMPYALWTRGAVAELIEHRFGLRLPVRTMGLYLSRWGFTPQKPIKRAYEQSPDGGPPMAGGGLPGDCGTRQGRSAVRFTGVTRRGCVNDDVRGRSLCPQGQTPGGTQ